MANETHYGIISDVHQDPRIVPATIEVLKKLGAEKLLINGDIGNQQRTLEDSQNYVAFILDSIGKSGLESYVQPGSHETLLAFGPVMDAFAGAVGVSDSDGKGTPVYSVCVPKENLNNYYYIDRKYLIMVV